MGFYEYKILKVSKLRKTKQPVRWLTGCFRSYTVSKRNGAGKTPLRHLCPAVLLTGFRITCAGVGFCPVRTGGKYSAPYSLPGRLPTRHLRFEQVCKRGLFPFVFQR